MFNDPNKHFPGPGSYNATTASENKNGFYLSSRYKSPGSAVISKSSQRFDNKDIKRAGEIPGPGKYNPHMVKTLKHYGVAIFGSAKRPSIIDSTRKCKK